MKCKICHEMYRYYCEYNDQAWHIIAEEYLSDYNRTRNQQVKDIYWSKYVKILKERGGADVEKLFCKS